METEYPPKTTHDFKKIKLNNISDTCHINSNKNDIKNSSQDNSKQKKKKRCFFKGCKKKITLLDFSCKCEHIFCRVHRMPENHDCSFDHKQEALNNLSKKLVKVVADKIVSI